MFPVLFKIGDFPVRSFGLMILVAFLAGLWLVRRRAEKYGFDVSKVTDLSFTVLIAGVLGARVLFILQEIPYYRQNPQKLLTLQFEGLTSFGGVLFGAGAVLWWAWRNKASVGRLADLFGPAFMFGHVFGRIGCYLNGCCHGGICPTNVPLATRIPNSPHLYYPAQLYDAGMNLAAVGLILLLERRSNWRPGQMAGLFLVLHGLTRFIYEFWRAGTRDQVARGVASSTYWEGLPIPITEAQVVALLMSLIGLVTIALAARRRASAPTAPEIQPA